MTGKYKIFFIIVLFLMPLSIFINLFLNGTHGRFSDSAKGSFQEDSLIFAAIGDPHYGFGDEHYAEDIIDSWMNDQSLPILDFGVCLGDLTHFGTPEEYEGAIHNSFGKLNIPWMFVFGNHDTANYKTGTGYEKKIYQKPFSAIEAGKNFTGTYGQNYAFLWDDILFLVVGDQGSTSLLTLEQRQWLDFMTDEYSSFTTVIFSHQGFITEMGNAEAYRYYNDIEWWESFIWSNPQLILLIHGHNHQFTHYQFCGLDVIDVGLTNDHGKPWTVIFEISNLKISANLYDVKAKQWNEALLFTKNAETTQEEKGISWYSFNKRVQNSQTFSEFNKIIAEEYCFQIIASDGELIQQNRDFTYWGHRKNGIDFLYASEEALNWIGYEDDHDNDKIRGAVRFSGKDNFSTSTKPTRGNQFPYGFYTKWEEGKVPFSTSPIAIPGQRYKLSARIKATREIENAFDVSVKVLGKNLSNIIMPSTIVLKNLSLNEKYQTFEAEFRVPEDEKSWIIKTTFTSKLPDENCYLDQWGLTQVSSDSNSESFQIVLNDISFSTSNDLAFNEFIEFEIEPSLVQQKLSFISRTPMNKNMITRFIYKKPIIWSQNLALGVIESDTKHSSCSFKPISTSNIGLGTVISFRKEPLDIMGSQLGRNGYGFHVFEDDLSPRKFLVNLV